MCIILATELEINGISVASFRSLISGEGGVHKLLFSYFILSVLVMQQIVS